MKKSEFAAEEKPAPSAEPVPLSKKQRHALLHAGTRAHVAAAEDDDGEPTNTNIRPRRFHIDRRAHLVSPEGDADDLLSTLEVALWLNVSTQFLEIGRHRGYGPAFVKISARCVRYRRGDVRSWLQSRTQTRTQLLESA